MWFQRKNGPGPIWDRSGNCGNCKFRKFVIFGIFIKIGKFSSSGLARIQEFEKHGLNICLAMVYAPDMIWKALGPCSKLDQPWNMLWQPFWIRTGQDPPKWVPKMTKNGSFWGEKTRFWTPGTLLGTFRRTSIYSRYRPSGPDQLQSAPSCFGKPLFRKMVYRPLQRNGKNVKNEPRLADPVGVPISPKMTQLAVIRVWSKWQTFKYATFSCNAHP